MNKFLRTLSGGSHLWKLLLLLLVPAYSQAQVSVYTFAASSGTFTPLPASATAVTTILGDDYVSPDIPIGFSFVYDGTTYNNLKATSNGYVSFGTLVAGTFGSTFTNSLSGVGAATADKPLIAPLWDDLNGHANTTGPSPSASYQTTGTAPNRVFTFEWLNWDWTYTATVSSISFQVKLYEGSNQIVFVYRPEANAPLTPSASIGLASGGTAGCPSSFLSLNNTSTAPVASSVTETASISTAPASGQTYTFTPPPPSSGSCAAVRCANISNITGNSAVVNFNGNTSATSYIVTYQAASGAVQTVTPAPTASPVNLVGLALNTTYTVTVTANCASGASTPVTLIFTTSNGYCTTGLGGTCGGNDITDISIIGTTLAASGLSCNTTPGGAYTNYPATGSTTGTVLRGVTYPISVTTTGNSIISAWIDFNHNLAFEANEWVQVDLSSTAGTASVASITIPTTVPGSVPPTYNGPTGFRVRSRISGNPNGAGDACLNFGSGEAKDFTIIIAPEPPCPAPTGLTATGISTTGATLNYTSVGAGTYTIIYGPLGFNPAVAGAGTSVTQTATTTGAMTLPVTNLQAGTTYQFYVQRNCGAAGLSVNTGPINFTTTIVNDEPCGATTLPLSLTGCVPYATTSIGATTSAPNGYTNPTTGCGIGGTPKDVWFKFTTSANGTVGSADVRITVTGNAASVVQALSATACTGPFTPIRCTGTGNNVAAPSLDLTGLTPNTTYYVRVFGYTPASATGNFTICVTPLPSCPTPVGATTTNITKSSAILTWMAGTGGVPAGSTYTVVYGPPGFNPSTAGTQATGITGNSFTLNALASQTNYCYYVRLICGGLNGNSNQVGPICFQTLLESPTNDDPCGAVALTSGAASTTGTTVGATTSTQPGITLPGCAPAQTPRDVWYSVRTPAATVGVDSLIIALTGTVAGQVRIYTAPDCANGPFALVGCQAASGSNTGFPSPIRIPNLAPGTTYYIAVSGYGSSDSPGNFGIAIRTVYVGPTCNPITALSASSITQTTASLGFTAGTNNTSYTVTYGPTGSTATTITTTTIPVALTGLLAGTAYTATVTPVCANGGSAVGTTTTFTTVAPVCDAVTAASAGSITSNSASIVFTAGAGNTSYNISYAAPSSPNSTATGTASPIPLTGLLPSTTYTVTITPVCSGGGTAPSTTFTFNTSAPVCDPVTGLSVTVRTIYDATVNFTPGAGNTSYTITYTPLGGATVVTTANASPVTLGGLQPGGAYTLTVTPICSGGGSAAPTSTTFATALGTRTTLGSGNVTLFPNPAHHSFTLAVPAVGSARTATVEIMNPLGQVVRQQSLTLNATGTQANVDIENLASGVYLVQLRTADQKAILRLIVD